MTAYPDHAVLLIGHGSSKRPGAAASLVRHANALRSTGRFGEVAAAALIGGSETPAAALARLTRDTAVIVPVMMCAGWTTRQVIPQALGLGAGGAAVRRTVVCDPLGLHPAFAALMARRAADCAALFGVSAASVTLLLIAHGSTKSAASQQATEAQAARIRAMGRFRGVTTAFLEQQPRLADVLATLVRPVIAVGCFAAPGHHATVDSAVILQTQAAGGVIDLGPIGDDPAIPDLIQQMVVEKIFDAVKVA
jgi:sirohydrochlorin ferrochelatase